MTALAENCRLIGSALACSLGGQAHGLLPARQGGPVAAGALRHSKALIEREPSFGHRTVAHLLGLNKNMVQRIFQVKRWPVRKRPVGFKPRI